MAKDFKKYGGRIVPITGKYQDMLALKNADPSLLKDNEIHTLDSHRRILMNGENVAGFFHGNVDNEAEMLNLWDTSEDDRGCYEGDTCFRTDTQSTWRCIGGRGEDIEQWTNEGATPIFEKKGDMIYGDASLIQVRLEIGDPGQILRVSDDSIPEWFSLTKNFGDLVVGGYDGEPSALSAGDENSTLRIIANKPGWVAPVLTEPGDLLTINEDGEESAINLPDYDGSGYFILITSGQGSGAGNPIPFWVSYDPVPNVLNGNGDLLIYEDNKSFEGYSRLGIGTKGQVLTVAATGLPAWETAASGSVATDVIWTAKGQIAAGTGTGTAAVLAPSTNGYVLSLDSTTATGLKWIAAGGGGGSGDVVGPASSTGDRLAIFDSTTGKLLKDSSGITAATGVLTSNTEFAVIAGGSNQNVRIKPSGTGVILLDVDSPIFENDTSKAGTSFSEFPRFRPKAGQNANGAIVISPRGSATESFIVLVNNEDVTLTNADYMAFGGGFGGAVSSSWNFAALKLANSTGTSRPISFVISNSSGRSEVLRINPAGSVDLKQTNPVISWDIGAGNNVNFPNFKPLTSNSNSAIWITPSGSATEASVSMSGNSAPDTTSNNVFRLGGGFGGAVSGSWTIGSVSVADSTFASRPISIVVGGAGGRLEVMRATHTSIQHRLAAPIFEYNVAATTNNSNYLVFKPYTTNQGGRVISAPSGSATSANFTVLANSSVDTTSGHQLVFGDGAGIPANHWGISASCYANATSNGRPFSIVLSRTAGRFEAARFLIDGGIWLGDQAALATNATGGFVFIPTCAGIPTGVPGSPPTGLAPMIIDTTNSRLNFYSNGAWRNSAGIGTRNLWIPATAMIPLITNGATLLQVISSGTNADIVGLSFHPSTEQYAQFSIAMPKSWNQGTVTFVFYWVHGGTTVNYQVVWGVRAVALSDTDSIGTAFGSGQNVTDTGGTGGVLYISAATAAVTISGSPAVNDMVNFEVYRAAADGSDTLAVAAFLIGVKMIYTTNAADDA